jgi:L-alanine-DL-glutamate epimerase-like enolase superfamily enzyme
MKITKISLFEIELHTKGGGFRRTSGLSSTSNTSYIVQVDTDEGISGYGEIVMLGTHYGHGWSGAVASGIPILARMILGEDPFQIEKINRQWDVAFKEDHYVKAAIDTALWDIMGKATGRPVHHLLGGHYPGEIPLYRSVHLFGKHENTPATWAERCADYRAEGIRHFQLKAPANPNDAIATMEAVCDILKPGEMALCDANGGWSYSDAVRICGGVRNLPVIIEQPCRTMEECINLRPHCHNPMKLDELMETTQDLLRAWNAGAVDYCTIKIGRVGGLTKARRMRDLCVDLGISVVPDDMWGSEFVSSAIYQLAWSTPPKYRLNATDLTDYVTVQTGDGFVRSKGGVLGFSDAPGLGVEPNMDVLGEPVAVCG